LHQSPSMLAIENLDAPFIGRFLNYLEQDRGNTPRSRNIRLAAIHSFFKYVALQEPSLSSVAQQVLAIPCKRHKTRPIDFLTRPEIDALLAAPDQGTYLGRRDRTLLLVAAQTVYSSELVRGASNGVVRGATGQMISLLAGGKNVMARGEGFKLDRGRRCGLVSRDGEGKVWAGRCGIERGKLPTLLRPKASKDL